MQQNTTTDLPLRLLMVIRKCLMVLGFVLFVLANNWSWHHMKDQAAVQGVESPHASFNAVSVLPR